MNIPPVKNNQASRQIPAVEQSNVTIYYFPSGTVLFSLILTQVVELKLEGLEKNTCETLTEKLKV